MQSIASNAKVVAESSALLRKYLVEIAQNLGRKTKKNSNNN